MPEIISAFWAQYGELLLEGTWETLIMVSVSTVLAYVIGVPLGVALIVTQPQGIRPHRAVYGVLGWIVNIGRSLPFAILLVALMPYTRLIVGTAIGVKGAIPPLVISAAPFVARMVETSLSEVDAGVVEAAQSMGASPLQIVRKVYLPEAMPSLILGGAISIVTILAYTAIAGTVGAGGLGDIAVRYGHQRGITSVMWVTVMHRKTIPESAAALAERSATEIHSTSTVTAAISTYPTSVPRMSRPTSSSSTATPKAEPMAVPTVR